MKISTVKYYSLGSGRDLMNARNIIADAQSRHPDWDFALLVNKRSATEKYTAARVEQLEVEIPAVDELDIPPAPAYPGGSYSTNAQAFEDYRHKLSQHFDALRDALKPVQEALRQWPPVP